MRRLAPLILVFGSISFVETASAQEEAASPDQAVIEIDSSGEATPEQAREDAPSEAAAEEPPGLAPKVPPNRAESERLAGEAEQAFLDGDFPRAIDLLKQAYESDQNPNMLYNIARVHEEQGQLEEALDFYRRFVVAPNVDLDYRREALQSSETIEQTLAAQDAAAREAAVREAQTAQDPADTANVLLRPAPFPTTSPMRPLGLTLAGIGGGAILAGAAVGIAALQKEKQFDEAGTLAERRAAGSSARDLATAADALYISGAVLVVTGIVTAFASPRRERPEGRQALNVTVQNDGVGATWTLRF